MKFIRLGEVLNKVSLSQATIYREMAKGEFPKPVHIGERSVAWIDSEIESWMESKIKSHRVGGISGGMESTNEVTLP